MDECVVPSGLAELYTTASHTADNEMLDRAWK